MKDLINFFFSFDKMMKHRLVPTFYWAALIYLAIWFVRSFLKGISLDPLAWVITPLEGLSLMIMAFVGLRVLCELAIAVFHINDNLSPDGGKSDQADIDPLAEARKAAEEATKRAREVTGKAVDKTKSAASNLKDSTSKSGKASSEKADDLAGDANQVFEKTTNKVKATAKKAAPKKTTVKKTTAAKTVTPKKKTTAKTTTAKKKTTTRKKPAPKS